MSNHYVVANLLDKLKQSDSDYRYMSLTDLHKELSLNSFVFDVNNSSVEVKVIHALIATLNDSNSEVQNMAIKCFTPLSMKISKLSVCIKGLIELLSCEKDTIKDVGALSLKSVLIHVPISHLELSTVIIYSLPALLSNLKSNLKNPSLDVIEIITIVLQKYGLSIINSSPDSKSLQQATMNTLLDLLDNSRVVVRKKAIHALSALSSIAFDDLFASLTALLLKSCSTLAAEGQLEKLGSAMSALSTIFLMEAARTGGAAAAGFSGLADNMADNRMASVTAALVASAIHYASFDDDEVKEQALQSLEVFVQSECVSASQLDDIRSLAMGLVSYDPNYIDDQDDDEEMDLDGDDDDQSNSDLEAYSDDDDVSYKVRRAAIRLLASLTTSHPSTQLLPFYTSISPLFIKRFSDRQESVRVELLSAFTRVVQQTGLDSTLAFASRATTPPLGKKRKGDNGETLVGYSSEDGVSQLRAQIPSLVTSLSLIFTRNEPATVLPALSLLQTVIQVVHGGLESSISTLFASIEPSLSSSPSSKSQHPSLSTTPNTNIKMSLLQLLSTIIHNHDVDVLSPYMSLLIEAIQHATLAKFYKVRTEALALVDTLVLYLCQKDQMATRFDQIQQLEILFDAVWTLLDNGRELEAEVTEKAIKSLGLLVSSVSDLLDVSYLDRCLEKFLVLIGGEMTRLTTAKSITLLCDSTIIPPPPPTHASKWTAFIPHIQPLITKNNKSAAFVALGSLVSLVKKAGAGIDAETLHAMVVDSTLLLSQPDQASLFPLAFELISTLLSSLGLLASSSASHSSSLATFTFIQQDLLAKLVIIITRQSHSVAGGAGLHGLVLLFKTLFLFEEKSGVYEGGICKLVQLASSSSLSVPISKEAFKVMAKCVGTATKSSNLSTLIALLLSNIESAHDESLQLFSLLCMGELGLEVDMAPFAPDLHSTIDQLISQSSDDIKNASAFCLGSLAVSNQKVYLPRLVENLRSGRQKYYYALAVNELVTQSSTSGDISTSLALFSRELWDLLFVVAAESQSEEGTRSLVADCIGKLLLLQADTFLPLLQENLSSSNEWIRVCVVAAFRYTLSHSPEKFDLALYPLIGQFLGHIGDESLAVRKMALTALSSAMHSKPELLRHVMDDLIPLLYKESEFKPELVQIVQMGPFQHKVDNGLDNRKIAFDCLSSLLDRPHSRLDFPLFISRIIAGLSDPSHEIKILSNGLLVKLVMLNPPVALDRDMPGLIEGLRENVFVKTKETAVKQEIENNRTLVLSCLKTIHVLEGGSSFIAASRRVKWTSFVQQEIKAATSVLSTLFKEVQTTST